MKCPYCDRDLGDDVSKHLYMWDSMDRWNNSVIDSYTVMCPNCDKPIIWDEVYEFKRIDVAKLKHEGD